MFSYRLWMPSGEIEWLVGGLALCTQTSAENLENCLLFTFCTQRLVEKQPAVSIMRER